MGAPGNKKCPAKYILLFMALCANFNASFSGVKPLPDFKTEVFTFRKVRKVAAVIFRCSFIAILMKSVPNSPSWTRKLGTGIVKVCRPRRSTPRSSIFMAVTPPPMRTLKMTRKSLPARYSITILHSARIMPGCILHNAFLTDS
ncbi:uncharacterized protein LOC143218712 [Lasioglossum baleicum]|uniref:uncharacterized protein LOC143218712 n=1 Tax=Lasioglossum baleicum TaxID=434251 RepID=UPI003FCD7B75